MTLNEHVQNINDELIAFRRALHRHPELGFEEFYTAEKCADFLRESGYEVKTGIAGTGVIGVLKGGYPGRCFAIRACLDALEIPEKTSVDYASENPGKMHACGHDGNMTVTLGAAKVLAQYRDVLAGSVKVILQPSEENTGGAAKIVAEGGLEDPSVDAIITPHIWHGIERGKVRFLEDQVMASSDLFEIKIHGKAGHGAYPQLAVDPVPIAADIILAIQKIVSREVDPMIPAIISIGKLEYGTAANIIADTITISGTVRTLDSGVRDLIQTRLCEVTNGIARAHRGSAEIMYDRIMPPLVNDPALTRRAEKVVRDKMGDDYVSEEPFSAGLGCEEFSVYGELVPGLFLFIGATTPDFPYELHNPKFLFPEECIPVGVRALSEIALDFLGMEINE